MRTCRSHRAFGTTPHAHRNAAPSRAGRGGAAPRRTSALFAQLAPGRAVVRTHSRARARSRVTPLVARQASTSVPCRAAELLCADVYKLVGPVLDMCGLAGSARGVFAPPVEAHGLMVSTVDTVLAHAEKQTGS